MVSKILCEAAKKLHNSETPMLDARVLLSYAAEVDNAALLFNMPDEKILEKFNSFISLRQKGIPVAYIIGEKEFMGLSFLLNEDTLIPRPDTERLVELIIEKNTCSSPKILDLCTGSGCIGISLAKFIPSSLVHLADICDNALLAARKNISRHGLQERIKAFRLDVLQDEIEEKYDIIVSNPPYIETDVLETLEVKKTEPVLALDGGSDGLDFYRSIVKKAPQSLKKGGMLAFEIGYNQGESVTSLLSVSFRDVKVYKDYGGNDRVVIGFKQ